MRTTAAMLLLAGCSRSAPSPPPPPVAQPDAAPVADAASAAVDPGSAAPSASAASTAVGVRTATIATILAARPKSGTFLVDGYVQTAGNGKDDFYLSESAGAYKGAIGPDTDLHIFATERMRPAILSHVRATVEATPRGLVLRDVKPLR